jgi:hypothetical protein
MRLEYSSTLAASTQNVLFVEMLKYSKTDLFFFHIFPKNILVMPRHIWARDYAHFGHVMDTKKHVSLHN